MSSAQATTCTKFALLFINKWVDQAFKMWFIHSIIRHIQLSVLSLEFNPRCPDNSKYIIRPSFIQLSLNDYTGRVVA